MHAGFLQLRQAAATLQQWSKGFSLLCILLLWSMGSRAMGFITAMKPVCLEAMLSTLLACGIFTEQGSNLCLLHWQVDS